MDLLRAAGRLVRRMFVGLWPTQRTSWTREGFGYILVWFALLGTGLYHQINLILLVAGLAAGPILASWFSSASMLRKVRVTRRVPAYVFADEPLHLDYTLENNRRRTAALALIVEDDLVPVDRTIAGSTSLAPRVFFSQVRGLDRMRVRWQGPTPARGKYLFRSLDLVTRSPFGLLERRVTIAQPDQLYVYPTVGQLSRRWHQVQRQASETRRGLRHDRSAQQQEYHGLREYRPGDSPRWIHWRTSARIGLPMVKEFEQHNEQDLAVLIDPWLPRSKVTPGQRESLEQVIRFAATVCLETCRHQGRRLLLGWTGPMLGVRQGPASVKLLHELLEQLAVMRPATEGTLSALLDALPPPTLREAILIVVSTRPVNRLEEAERSARLSGGSARGLMGRVILLDASRGDLTDLIQFAESPSATALQWHESHLSLSAVGPGSDRPSLAAGSFADVAVLDPARTRSRAPEQRGERPMTFTSIYRISFYLMLFFATLTLSVDVPESTIAMFFPLAVALASVIAFFTVDRYPSLGLSQGLSNWLALASIGLVFLEFSSDSQLLLLSLAHWLVYLQLIKMFLPKRVEDDWFLFLLGLMQVLVGAVGSQSDLVGQAMSAWALLALWVLALFSLHRDALRYLPRPQPGGEFVSTSEDPYPGLLNLPFLLAALRVTATTLALGGVIFMAMPRRSSMARLHAGALPARHLTGFDEEVKLGQLGEILENDSVVMSIELYDSDWKRIAPPFESLWRGVTMTSYDKGRWHRPERERPDRRERSPSRRPVRAANRKLIRQHIRLEPTDSAVLFGLRPMLDARSNTGPRTVPDLNAHDGTIVRDDPRSETYDYRVDSGTDPNDPQPLERLPRRVDLSLLMEIPQPLREPLLAIAERQVQEIPPDAPLPDAPRAGTVSPQFGLLSLLAPPGYGRFQARSRHRLSGQPQVRSLRLFCQRADPLAPLDRPTGPDGQRVQGG